MLFTWYDLVIISSIYKLIILKVNGIFALFLHNRGALGISLGFLTANLTEQFGHIRRSWGGDLGHRTRWHVRIQRGEDRGSRPSLENDKNIGFLCNTDPDPLKNNKSQHSMYYAGPPSARQRNIILMVFRWQADVGPLLTVLGSSLPQKKTKKTLAELDPLWQNFLDPRMDDHHLPNYEILAKIWNP